MSFTVANCCLLCLIVFHYCRTWRPDGVGQPINDALCLQTRQNRYRRYRQPIGENPSKRGPRSYDYHPAIPVLARTTGRIALM